MTSSDLYEMRLHKLNKIKELGINAFPTYSVERELISNVLVKALDSSVKIAGRLLGFREHGKITFSDVSDESGKIQLAFKEDVVGTEKYDFLKLLDGGDFVSISGKLFKTKAGELTIEVKTCELLTKSLRTLPSEWYGFKDIEERYRQRYVDLVINKDVKKVFDIRHKVLWEMRNFMVNEGFTEVETPTLQPLYGGATAKPFVTHNNSLDVDLYLRIADELYLKRLIVGGFEKVFEICKDFRNEGIDRQHNPEFSMMEFYWAYADYEDLMRLTEKLVSTLVQKIHNAFEFEFEGTKLNFQTPFKRMTFVDLVLEHSGIDLNICDTEEKLQKEINEKKIKLNMEGIVGYGMLCDTLYKEVARPKVVGPLFLTDYPTHMKPLAKRKLEDKNKSASFQLLCMGYELVNAYNELNDPIDQRERWEEEMRLAGAGVKEYQVIDEDYIRALEYGMPPTAGWGMGIDRFVSILTNQHSLKDVILFPTLRPEV